MPNLSKRRTTWLRRLACVAIALAAPNCWSESSIQDWLQSSPLETDQRQEVATLLGGRPLGLEELSRLVALYAHGDVVIAELAALIDSDRPPSAPRAEKLSQLPATVVADLALRASAQHHFQRQYPESLAWLELADPDACSAPQLYWYYRAIACHQLVRMEEALEAAKALQAIDQPGERRVQELAKLIHRDAATHKPNTLTHIARQMGDVRRRLWLGQSGEPNQSLQQEVIDSLDKLIEQAEEQRRQQQQQQQQQQMAQRDAARPMEQSRIADLKSAGEVDDRDITPGGDWGSLPPAERERVTQQIIRDFPAHYREVIEDYFRSLATDPAVEEGDR